jgi:hypothetical protein
MKGKFWSGLEKIIEVGKSISNTIKKIQKKL